MMMGAAHFVTPFFEITICCSNQWALYRYTCRKHRENYRKNAVLEMNGKKDGCFVDSRSIRHEWMTTHWISKIDLLFQDAFVIPRRIFFMLRQRLVNLGVFLIREILVTKHRRESNTCWKIPSVSNSNRSKHSTIDVIENSCIFEKNF